MQCRDRPQLKSYIKLVLPRTQNNFCLHSDVLIADRRKRRRVEQPLFLDTVWASRDCKTPRTPCACVLGQCHSSYNHGSLLAHGKPSTLTAIGSCNLALSSHCCHTTPSGPLLPCVRASPTSKDNSFLNTECRVRKLNYLTETCIIRVTQTSVERQFLWLLLANPLTTPSTQQNLVSLKILIMHGVPLNARPSTRKCVQHQVGSEFLGTCGRKVASYLVENMFFAVNQT